MIYFIFMFYLIKRYPEMLCLVPRKFKKNVRKRKQREKVDEKKK